MPNARAPPGTCPPSRHVQGGRGGCTSPPKVTVSEFLGQTHVQPFLWHAGVPTVLERKVGWSKQLLAEPVLGTDSQPRLSAVRSWGRGVWPINRREDGVGRRNH